MTELKAETTKNFDEIKKTLNDASKQYVPISEFIAHLKADEDHEARIRKNTSDIEVVQTQLKTYGVALAVAFSLIQLILHFIPK